MICRVLASLSLALGWSLLAHDDCPAADQPAVDAGRHWAFAPPVRPAVPQPKNAAWVRGPIDAFVADEHEKRGLSPQPPAPKRILLRRVYLDLVGLPPTPEEVRAFLVDDSPDAYEKTVDRLLDSPRYGERWGRHWMDVWRYSDWYGYRAELRSSARHIWRWRDWIVESLNQNKPYDQMIVEMLAADEAYPGDLDRLRATGFLARPYYKFNRDVWLDSAIEHTGKAFLGITLDCARCHDHKYDPIPQTDYYRFRAIFEPYQVRTDPVPGELDAMKDGIPVVYDAEMDAKTYVYLRGNDKHPDKDNPLEPAVPAFLGEVDFDRPGIELPREAWYPALRPYARRDVLDAARAKVAAKQQAFARARDAHDGETGTSLRLAEKQLAAARSFLAALEARIAAEDAKHAQPPPKNALELARAAGEAERLAALHKGEAAVCQAELDLERAGRSSAGKDQIRPKAVAEAQKKLAAAKKQLESARKIADRDDGKDEGNYEPLGPTYPKTSTGRRLALARWIADEENPLTARVAVNHIWTRHFSRPLVPTVFDFGMSGTPPSHPELLDWLACEFMSPSAADDRSGLPSSRPWSMKHLHRLIVTSNAYRMHSSTNGAAEENVRTDPDNVYLWRMNSRRMEAEIVRDSILHVAGQLDATMGGPELDSKLGQTTYRSSIYYRHAPEKFMPLLETFNAASTHECYRRNETVVPQQALALVNSPLSLEQARRLAALLNEQVGASADPAAISAFIGALFELVLCRPPTDEELAACSEFVTQQTSRLSDSKSLTPFTGGTASQVKPATEPHLRARENLAHVLLNHNEFVTIR